jgi:hypothetical protein
MRRFRLVGACAVLFVACSDNSSTTDAGTDAGPDVAPKKDSGGADVAADAPDDTGTPPCNTLVAADAAVQQMKVATTPVVGDGGLFAPGTYVLVGASVYTGPDGGTGPTGTTMYLTTTIDDAGAFAAIQILTDGGAPAVNDSNGTLTPLDGGALSGKQTCPGVGSLIFTSYSSDGTNIGLYAPKINPPQAIFMQKQ